MREWLRNIPEEIITARLVVRRYRPGDGQAVYEAIMDSLDDLRRWPADMGWALGDQSPDHSEEFCRTCSTLFDERFDFPLLITLRDSGAVVGSSGLHRPDWSVPKLEIGWWGRSTFGKQGLISEATEAILEFAFAHLRARRVFARVDEENVASARICERMGMSLEGLMMHERAEPDGTLRNTRLYAIVR